MLGAQSASVNLGVIGNYELQRVIGEGGIGTVYEATHRVTKRRVALKVLKNETLARSPNIKERFLMEARAAAKIKHPGIADVLDAGEDGEQVYIAFEYLDGCDLSALMDKERIPEVVLVSWMIDLLEALHEAHKQNFIHRDIKPANIFVAKDTQNEERIKLLDFGIAKKMDATSRLTVEGSLIGTPTYMSPEQLMCTTVTPQSDLWSLGVVMYHALTGSPPFKAKTSIELVRAIIFGEYKRLPNPFPQQALTLPEIVHKALQTELSDRWGSALEMREALIAYRKVIELEGNEETAVSGAPVTRQPPEPDTDEMGDHATTVDITPAVAPTQPHRSPIPVLLLSIALAVAAAGVVTYRASKKPAPSKKASKAPVVKKLEPPAPPSVPVEPKQLDPPKPPERPTLRRRKRRKRTKVPIIREYEELQGSKLE